MKTGEASGAQIAFLTFAVALLSVPVAGLVVAAGAWSGEEGRLIYRATPFLALAAILAAVPVLRRRAREELSRPIPRDRRREVLLVAAASLTKGFAWAGLWVLAWWLAEGAAAVDYRLRLLAPHDAQMARAATGVAWLHSIVLAGFLAPVVEELVFRRFLYRAWERRWGWVASMLLTSTLFGLYHPNFFPAFTASVLYVCLYRRTGSLWAPIAVHSLFNIAAFYPLLGQLHFNGARGASGDLAGWGLQLACLLFVLVALPLYAWMSRDASSRLPWTTPVEPVPR